MYELAFEPELFAAGGELARSVVGALVRSGIRDVVRLSNTAFHLHHPDHDLARKIDPAKEPELARQWNELKQSVVLPALGGGVAGRVLLVGDSHTNSAFGAELQKLLEGGGAAVVREAKDGSAVKYWVPRMPELLAKHAPSTVIVALGANMRDYASRGSIAPLVAAVRAGAPSARLVWIGPPKHRDASAAEAQQLDANIRAGLDAATAFVSSLPFTPAFRGASDGEHYAADLARAWAHGVFGALGPVASHELELTFEPEQFLGGILGAARAALAGDRGTLEVVARWLVGDLIRSGQRDPGELTDAAFAVLHHELGGRRLERSEAALIAEYRRIQREVVTPLLAGGATAAPAGVPRLDGPRQPAGYRVANNGRGLARYSGDRLETKLRALMASGHVKDLSEEDLDTFQRIANVETGGGTQALNTWDSAVVSIGFFQLTLKYGELQHLISMAAPAFARHGIELDPSAKYKIGDEVVTAIRGAELSQIRWGGWAERFYLAGLDPDVIAAEVEHGKTLLAKELGVAKKVLGAQYAAFRRAYDASLPLRGLYQEARNNHPTAAKAGLVAATRKAIAENADPQRFYKLATLAMVDAFATVKGNRESGQRLVAKTACGLGTLKTEWPC